MLAEFCSRLVVHWRNRCDKSGPLLLGKDRYLPSGFLNDLLRLQFFLVGDYRSDLLDILQGIADADPTLVGENWVRTALDDIDDLSSEGRIILAKNYGRKLIDPIPFEAVGTPSRFLTYQWLHIRKIFESMLSAAS